MLKKMIREGIRLSKRISALAEQLRQKVNIIRMNQRKILELSKKFNEEVKEVKEQLAAMKKKVELIDEGVEKEKKIKFEGQQSDKMKSKSSVFLVFLLNNFKAEAAM
ncbi:uncharacterized protein MONOS_4922 [Monocercomonoides exilis]|uniref:uncharacterized protein n=1 Tax=Monocercomonoides exilis TaxID=2049356 RepID=UPI00355943B7|nr:hypothetical protein MONOS_4922 [Monocercomonoides exilis]|eukprot:MONOS_4922.1-p1 / transcript=MONOS_4922.1 / gene=MONOS_4922 / organism=Monocercomonoides_exilis_PA203 / gene_product=unspecified product / transcript_product=unspecified product / location=Mono_scaffold00138:3844-4164(-) / protein_length=107 / sequence_SO=supercontig / SO=protein_coding / is_pseudo=false